MAATPQPDYTQMLGPSSQSGTFHVFSTTVFSSSVALEVVSIPATGVRVQSANAIEQLTGFELKRWEPLLESSSREPETVVRDLLSGHVPDWELEQLLHQVFNRPLIATEASDAVLQSLSKTVGTGGAAAVTILYGITIMGPVAVFAVPAGIFLIYIAHSGGQGIGGWIKRRLGPPQRGSRRRRSPGDGSRRR